MVDQKDMAETATHGVAGDGAAGPALRDAEGAIRPEFVETVAEAVAGAMRGCCARWSANCTRPIPAT
jgi:hypothetical protein